MLFETCTVRAMKLANRVVMSPMTRSRASHDNIPNELMMEYYAQRASAGLIITEGTSPSPNGLGYPRIPGLFNDQQVQGWKQITDAVHAKGGKIVVQLMHTGRVSNDINLGPGGETIGPSAEICPGDMFTDSKGLQPNSAPRPMNEHDIQTAVDEYGAAASYALEAGFDGIELHAANGYLIEQFLNPHVNLRNDEYGVDITGRNRFALRVVNAAVKAIGAQRVGIRLSPYGVFNGTGAYPEVDEQYLALIKELSHSRLMYVHVLDHSAMGAPVVPAEIKLKLRQAFDGPFILTGGFDAASAETTLDVNLADLIGFGRPFVANPDLVRRMQIHAALNPPDMATFYTPGPKGYTDYPTLAE